MTAGAAGVPGPLFTVSGAARRLGIPAATLRTWERRHGIGPSARSPGGHRRYTWEDLVRLRAMRTLVETGIPPAQAAGLAARAAHGEGGRSLPAGAAASATATSAAAGQLAGPLAGHAGPPGPAPPPGMVVRAALALDAPLLRTVFTDAFASYGVTATWQQLAVPALGELGDRAPPAGHVAAEHLLSGCLLSALLQVITQAPPAHMARPVVLACAEEEQHVLPVYALQAELASRGVDVRQLGGRVPRQALAHAVRAVRPAAVFVWAQVPGTADPALLHGLQHGLPPVPRVVIGGPGWPRAAGIGQVSLVSSLASAADLLVDCALVAS